MHASSVLGSDRETIPLGSTVDSPYPASAAVQRAWRHGARPRHDSTPPRQALVLRSLKLRLGQLYEKLTDLHHTAVWDRLAERLASARRAEEIETALVDAARQLTGEVRVKLVRVPRDGSQPAPPRSGERDWPLRFAGRTVGFLRIHAGRRRRAARRQKRQLERLAVVAGASLLAADQSTTPKSARRTRPVLPEDPASVVWPRDQVTGLPGAEYLECVLADLHRARPDQRCGFLLIAADDLVDVRAALGPEFADAALGIVARVVRATLRASDPIVRLDTNRLAVVLPGASRGNVDRVATALESAIAEAGLTSSTPRPLTATIGRACVPDDAHDADSLIAAALDDLRKKLAYSNTARLPHTPTRHRATVTPPNGQGISTIDQFSDRSPSRP